MTQPNWVRVSWLDVAALNGGGATIRSVSDGETRGHVDTIWQADANTIPTGFVLSMTENVTSGKDGNQ